MPPDLILHQIQNVLPVLLFLGDIFGLAFSSTLVLWLLLSQQLNGYIGSHVVRQLRYSTASSLSGNR